MGAREPLRARSQTHVDRFLVSSQRVDVGAIGGEAGRYLVTFRDRPVAGDQDIDVPGGLFQAVECPLLGAYLIWAASVEERDQDIGEHVAGEQDATVREEDRGVADCVRLMLDDLARHRSAVRGQRGDERDQQEREGAQIAEITHVERLDLTPWPDGSRVIIRRERPHPGAQLKFTDANGHRFQATLTDLTGD